MPLRGRLDLEEWLNGVVAAFVIGGAGAVTAVCGPMVNDPIHFNWGNWQVVARTAIPAFLVCGVLGGLAWVYQNGIPRVTAKITETEVSRNDAGGVSIKTVETTTSTTPEKETPIT